MPPAAEPWCIAVTNQVHGLPQVVVVVTNNWDVLCFDHNLRLRWSHKIKARRRPTIP